MTYTDYDKKITEIIFAIEKDIISILNEKNIKNIIIENVSDNFDEFTNEIDVSIEYTEIDGIDFMSVSLYEIDSNVSHDLTDMSVDDAVLVYEAVFRKLNNI